MLLKDIPYIETLDNLCMCSGKHVPKPTRLFIIELDEEEVFLCPTTYINVLSLMEKYEQGGRPPGRIRKHYSEYVQYLVERLING